MSDQLYRIGRERQQDNALIGGSIFALVPVLGRQWACGVVPGRISEHPDSCPCDSTKCDEFGFWVDLVRVGGDDE